MRFKIIKRHCGGYLAVTTDHPKIGVEANTEDEALEKLTITLARWQQILTPPPPSERSGDGEGGEPK